MGTFAVLVSINPEGSVGIVFAFREHFNDDASVFFNELSAWLDFVGAGFVHGYLRLEVTVDAFREVFFVFERVVDGFVDAASRNKIDIESFFNCVRPLNTPLGL